MDWNWFFSSLAQSVAAIVGIFAAFIITKVINNQGEFGRKNTRLKELLSLSKKYSDALANRYFGWYCDRSLEEALRDLDNALDEEKESRSAEEYYDELSVPQFMPRSEVLQRIERVMDTHQNRSQSKELYSRLITKDMIAINARLRDKVDEERNLIDVLIIDLRQHIRLAQLHLSDIESNPESAPLISYSIVGALVLFFAGVIYPLSFLPVNPNKPIAVSLFAFFVILLSLKGLMLSVTSIVFSIIMAIFWRVNSSLKYSGEDLERLRKATQIQNYSKYLGIMEGNIQEQEAWRENQELLHAKKPV